MENQGERRISEPLRCISRSTFLDSDVWAPFWILLGDFCSIAIFIGNCGERRRYPLHPSPPTFLHSAVWAPLSWQHQFQIQLVSSHKLPLLPWIFLLPHRMSPERLVVFVSRQKSLEGALEAANDHWVGPDHPHTLSSSFLHNMHSGQFQLQLVVFKFCTQWSENIVTIKII